MGVSVRCMFIDWPLYSSSSCSTGPLGAVLMFRILLISETANHNEHWPAAGSGNPWIGTWESWDSVYLWRWWKTPVGLLLGVPTEALEHSDFSRHSVCIYICIQTITAYGLPCLSMYLPVFSFHSHLLAFWEKSPLYIVQWCTAPQCCKVPGLPNKGTIQNIGVSVFLPGESQGWGSLWAAIYGVAQSWTWLKWLSSSSSNRIPRL